MVPESINGEILENLDEDESYLERQGFVILDDDFQPLDPREIDFSDYSGEDFPYTFRQGPGPLNALGRVKFLFPNEFNVYLHDTPSRELFRREDRTFSHGCIRIEHPLELAEALLPEWTRADLEQTIASGDTRSVALENPLPVLVLYWTATADMHGELHFYRDIYDRDGALLAALDRNPAR
jgi:murein L,D-transpeptidase YcbB/YkuD